MHDLHEANKIFKLILANAAKNKLKKVTQAEIDLGGIFEHGDEINPENLEFNLKILAKDSIAENMDIKINKIKGDSWILKQIKGD